MNTTTANIFVIIAWALTIGLVTQLLSGTFETRQCHSLCSSLLYYAAFAVAIIGTGLSLRQCLAGQCGIFGKLILLAGLVLIMKLAGVMIIGTLAG